jgi:hypothetical protein
VLSRHRLAGFFASRPWTEYFRQYSHQRQYTIHVIHNAACWFRLQRRRAGVRHDLE